MRMACILSSFVCAWSWMARSAVDASSASWHRSSTSCSSPGAPFSMATPSWSSRETFSLTCAARMSSSSPTATPSSSQVVVTAAIQVGSSALIAFSSSISSAMPRSTRRALEIKALSTSQVSPSAPTVADCPTRARFSAPGLPVWLRLSTRPTASLKRRRRLCLLDVISLDGRPPFRFHPTVSLLSLLCSSIRPLSSTSLASTCCRLAPLRTSI
mmetsp:Transcript_69166/g.218799  ORF Transcript_69166/g.218799 Transcript_69166/m.218799 type:complete len:214 (-) Transcript_69166:676-1317(-)